MITSTISSSSSNFTAGLSSEFIAAAARTGFSIAAKSFGFSLRSGRSGHERPCTNEVDALTALIEKRRQMAWLATQFR